MAMFLSFDMQTFKHGSMEASDLYKPFLTYQ
jgi:hypothetical protein